MVKNNVILELKKSKLFKNSVLYSALCFPELSCIFQSLRGAVGRKRKLRNFFIKCFSAYMHVFLHCLVTSLTQFLLNLVAFSFVELVGPFVMWTNHKQPHLWCENTVSHHGVYLARLKMKGKRKI